MRIIATIAALLAASAFGSETVIEVPQGSGVFPTVGQVDCLEEAGSGRFCAATYECADESGDLWGDLANHDGRRAIGSDSPVARERGCTITVDGKAAVRWFVGFSPDGRDGELAGLTPKHDALKPVHTVNATRVVQGGSNGEGSFLSWFVETFDVGDLRTAVRQSLCNHWPDDADDNPRTVGCVREFMGAVVHEATRENTPVNRCVAEALYDLDGRYASRELNPISMLTNTRPGTYRGGWAERPADMFEFIHALGRHPENPTMDRVLPGRYAECRRLLEEQWEREGFGELQ